MNRDRHSESHRFPGAGRACQRKIDIRIDIRLITARRDKLRERPGDILAKLVADQLDELVKEITNAK